MKRRLTILVLTALAVVAISGVASTSTFTPDADAKSETVSYLWFAGVGTCVFPPCPDEATASNGHAIEIAGQGALQVHPKDVSGGGKFTYRDAPDGEILEAGTFKAIELLNFKSYGPGEGVPADWRAGLARIRVELLVGEDKVGEAILSVGCILPGVKIPGGDKAGAGLFEGVKVNALGGELLGGLNFSKPTEPRATLFVELE